MVLGAIRNADALTEIGVALTTFGALFMLLGVMLFFDGALLALGNVRTQTVSCSRLLNAHSRFSSFPALLLSLDPKKPSTSSRASKKYVERYVLSEESCSCL